MIVDISNILYPTIANTIDIVGTAYHLLISGNYMFASAGTEGIITYDITDKTNPVEVSRIDSSTMSTHGNGTVICGVCYVGLNDYSIRVYDTSDKANPNLIGEYNDGSEYGRIFLYNNHIFAANLDNGSIVIGFSEHIPTSTNGFGLNFLAVFIMTTFVLGYGFAKRKKGK